DYEGVFRVVGEHGEDCTGLVGSGLAENVGHAWVADDHVRVLCFAGVRSLAENAGDSQAPLGQFAAGVDSEWSVADDYEMIFAIHFYALSVDDTLEALADQRADDGGERSGEDGDPENDDGDSEELGLRRLRGNISVADGAHGDHCVVESGDEPVDGRLVLTAEIECAEGGVHEQHGDRGEREKSAGRDAGAVEMPPGQKQRGENDEKVDGKVVLIVASKQCIERGR